MIEEVNATYYENTPCLEVKGRIREEDNSRLQQKLNDLEHAGNTRIIVDITKADFIDSHGLGVLIYFHKALETKNGALIILNTNTNSQSYMNKLFETTKLSSVLNIASSLEEAKEI